MIRGGDGTTGQALNDVAIDSFKGIEGVEGATGVIMFPMQIKIGGLYCAKHRRDGSGHDSSTRQVGVFNG